MALPKKLRLPRREFIITREKGKTYSGKQFSAVIHPRLSDTKLPNRYAVVISSRIHKSAVVRNRLKRLIYGGLRGKPGKGLNIIIYPKKLMLNLSHEETNFVFNHFLSEIYPQSP